MCVILYYNFLLKQTLGVKAFYNKVHLEYFYNIILLYLVIENWSRYLRYTFISGGDNGCRFSCDGKGKGKRKGKGKGKGKVRTVFLLIIITTLKHRCIDAHNLFLSHPRTHEHTHAQTHIYMHSSHTSDAWVLVPPSTGDFASSALLFSFWLLNLKRICALFLL